jgi:trk system potassium uptake protein TrkA
MTARTLTDLGHDVVIIDSDRERVDEASEELDCSFLNADGTRPSVLREADPEATDILFCLSGSDQVNLIASLVGKTLGFGRVITGIQDLEFVDICRELGLSDVIVPDRTISRYLADLVRGVDIIELSSVLRGSARLFTFTCTEDDAGKIDDLDLPGQTDVVFLYRDGDLIVTERETVLKTGDEVVLITDSQYIGALRERWNPKDADDSEGDADASGDSAK